MKKITKLGVALLSSFLLAAPLAACGETPVDPTPVDVDVDVTEVKCQESTLNLKVDDTYKLTCSVLPENATNKTLTFSSSKEDVASVDAEGNITAKGKGTTIITITSNNGKTANVAVSVTEKEQEVVLPQDLILEDSSAELIIGETKQINASILPENATNKNVEYVTGNRLVATVSSGGLISAVGVGSTTITVRSQAKPEINKTFSVTVKTNVVAVTNIEIEKSALSLHPGESETIAYNVLPENATDKSVSFEVVSGEGVVEVDSTGSVIAKGVGDARISVKSNQNGSVYSLVTVHVELAYVPVTNLTVSTEEITIVPNGTAQINASVEPHNATETGILYSSNEPTIASVDATGKVTAGENEGTAIISVVSKDNDEFAKQVTVKVEKEVVDVESVTIQEDDLAINIGDKTSYQLHATVLPDDASDKSLAWSSNNVNVATVNSEGLVTIKGVAGEAIITAKSSSNESISDSFKLTVSEVLVTTVAIKSEGSSVDEISFSTRDIGVNTKTLTVDVAPAHATDPSIIWSSEDATVATVSNGVVTPKGIGQTTIKANNVRSGKYDEVTVKVLPVEVENIVVKLDGSEVSNIKFKSDDIDANTKTLVASVVPDDATNKDVVWSSSNTNIVTVENGVVTPKGVGSAKIRVASEDNAEVYKEISVDVNEVLVESIDLRVDEQSISSLEFNIDDIGDVTKAVTVAALCTPATAYDTDVSFNIINTNIATVTDAGVVSPKALGETELVVTNAKSGVEKRIPVRVVTGSEVVLPVSRNQSFITFDANRGVKDNKQDEFYVRDNLYKVGSDNNINLTPQFKVIDSKTKTPVEQSRWAYDYTINVKKYVDSAWVDATDADYAVVNARNCLLKFTDEAVGSKFQVSVLPGNEKTFIKDEDDRIDATANYQFEVAKGFNVYRPEELSYFDSTNASWYSEEHQYVLSGETRGKDPSGMPRTIIDYPKFKREHNLNENASYNNLVFHSNFDITPNDIPAEFLYSANECKHVEAVDREATLGSFKDYMYIYMHLKGEETNVEGNYFKLSFENIPLAHRPGGRMWTTGEDGNKMNSHCAAFRTLTGDTKFENLNIVGNAHNAKDSSGEKYAGGLMFIKGYGLTKSLELNNILSHAFFMTAMTEAGSEDGAAETDPISMDVNYLKCFDHYNSFFYNWGGIMNISNSSFEGSGGPVIIQDHTAVDTDVPTPVFDEFLDPNPEMPIGNFHIIGNAPDTTFENCEFNNNVIGKEGWFQSFGATSQAATIKSLSDVVSAYSQKVSQATGGLCDVKTFLRAKTGSVYTPVTSGAAADMGLESEMNFIVLNKSGASEGVTPYLVDGTVTFIKNGEQVDMFDYMKPKTTFDKDQDAYAAQRTLYQSFRGLQKGGLPIVEIKGGSFGVYPHDNTAQVLDVIKFAAQGGTNPMDPGVQATDPIFLNCGDYLAIYYTGMMLIVGMYSIGA
ncbi:MAG: Ig-like domain-containing protein [Bacilli bacterium]|nr:Ig-like domain-containing protein [Bacilli bacterium]